MTEKGIKETNPPEELSSDRKAYLEEKMSGLSDIAEDTLSAFQFSLNPVPSDAIFNELNVKPDDTTQYQEALKELVDSGLVERVEDEDEGGIVGYKPIADVANYYRAMEEVE